MLSAGCASQRTADLRIDTTQVPVSRYQPDEMTRLLKDLGYVRQPDPESVRWAQSFENYEMRFVSPDAPGIHIDVHMQLVNKLTTLEIYNINENKPSEDTLRRYREIRKRVEMAYGADNVKHSHP